MALDLEQFHEAFFEEAFEALDTMESALLKLNIGNPEPELVNTIFRVAHSIKGNASAVGFNHVARLAHAFEDTLTLVRDHRLGATPELTELLLGAVAKVPALLSEPKPFVLQTALGDFSVAYEVNALTRESHELASIYSALHAAIQDAFNAAGVEIMSPQYHALRDGNTVTTPEEHRPAGYVAPAFRVQRGEG